MPVPFTNPRAPMPRYYSKPGQLRQEYFVDAVLLAATESADGVLQRRPPVPQKVFPETTGYRRMPLTIGDVLATDRWAPQVRSWVSGAPAIPISRDRDTGASAGFRNVTHGGFT